VGVDADLDKMVVFYLLQAESLGHFRSKLET
jgi:hypothetical protein